MSVTSLRVSQQKNTPAKKKPDPAVAQAKLGYLYPNVDNG
jgi:hypothetical protein